MGLGVMGSLLPIFGDPDKPKRARLWLATGSCVRTRPERPNDVWSYDFVADRTRDGRPFRILSILDEYTRECLASVVARRIRSQDVLLILAELFVSRGIPTHIRSDNVLHPEVKRPEQADLSS